MDWAKLIQDLGFPIAASMATSSVVIMFIKWFMKKFDMMYQDHRADVQYIIDRFAKAMDKIIHKQETLSVEHDDIKKKLDEIKHKLTEKRYGCKTIKRCLSYNI